MIVASLTSAMGAVARIGGLGVVDHVETPAFGPGIQLFAERRRVAIDPKVHAVNDRVCVGVNALLDAAQMPTALLRRQA